MEYYNVINIIREAKVFNDEILNGIRYNFNIKEVKSIFEERINSKLIKYSRDNTKINIQNNILDQIKDQEAELNIDRNFATYHRIISSKYDFIIKKDNFYIFETSLICKNCRGDDFSHAVEEITGTIFQENIIEILNKLNYLLFLKSLTHKSRYNFAFILSIKWFAKKYSYWFTIIFALTSISIFSYYVNERIELSSISQQAISLSIIGALTSFLGFAVVFFQLSFDNFKKTYGSYAKVILYKSFGSELVYTFIGTIFFAMISAIFEKENYTIYNTNIKYYVIQNLSFNITVSLFFIFIVKLLKKLEFVFNYSLSYKNLKHIVRVIDLQAIKELKPNYSAKFNTDAILNSYEINHIEILSEIITNSILQNNHKIAEVLLLDLTNHFQNNINGLKSGLNFKNDIQDITKAYTRILNKSIETTYKSPFRDLITTCHNNISAYNFTIAINKSNIDTFLDIINLINFAIDKSIENNSIDDILSGLSSYKKCVFDHIFYNTPYNYETQSGSIAILTDRREILKTNSFHWNRLIIYSTQHFYNLTMSCMSKVSDSSNLLTLIWNYAEMLERVILYKIDVKSIRYELIEQLSHYTLLIYKDAFKKKIFKEDLLVHLPFDISIIDYLIKFDKRNSQTLLNRYKAWCDFIISEDKTPKYISYCVESTISLFRIQIKYIEEVSNNKDNSIMENSLRIIKDIASFYNNLNYSPNSLNKSTVQEIHSIFWSFRQFDKVSMVIDKDFYSNIDQIIEKTNWSTFQNTEAKKSSFTNTLFFMLEKLFRR